MGVHERAIPQCSVVWGLVQVCNDEIRMSPRGPLPSGQCTSIISVWLVSLMAHNFDSSCRNECTNIFAQTTPVG